MLSQLYIENIAVIRQATIDFQQGFHVFTGETGAGKTILISAINAVLGGRTFKEIIRTGETRATVSALFTEISEELCKKIEVLGYPLEDNQLLVQREIDLSGKGQCRLDGRPATAQGRQTELGPERHRNVPAANLCLRRERRPALSGTNLDSGLTDEGHRHFLASLLPICHPA